MVFTSWTRVVVLAAIGATLGGRASATNILVLVADDFGADKIGLLADYSGGTPGGQFLPATPTVDQLAASGLLFTNAWANPLCSPTRAGLLTGLFPYHSGIGAPQNTTEDPGLAVDTVTLPRVLQDAGYETALFGKWHLGFAGSAGTLDWDYATDCADGATTYTEDANPLLLGFDTYLGSLGGIVESFTAWYRIDSTGDGTTTACTDTSNYPDELYASSAETWINTRTGPFFAVVSFNAPHTDADGRSERREWEDLSATCQSTVATWDVCMRTGACGDSDGDGVDDSQDLIYQYQVQCLDTTMHDLLSSIDPTVLADTLIVFLGDNGTPGNNMSEYNDVEDPYDRSVSALTGDPQYGKGSTFLSGVRVPYIVADGASWTEVEAGMVPSSHRITHPGRVVPRDIVVEDTFASFVTVAGATAVATDGGDFSGCLSSGTRACSAAGLAGRPQYAEVYSYADDGSLSTSRAVLMQDGWRLAMEYDSANGCVMPSLFARGDTFDERDVYTTEPAGRALKIHVNRMDVGWMPTGSAGAVRWCR